jgi:hypothetical protein
VGKVIEVIEVKVGSDWGRGRVGRLVVGPEGIVEVPTGWVHVPPGDPLVTRRIKARGPVWVVTELVRNKTFARGLFAPYDLVERVRAQAEAERGSGDYQKKLEAGRARREREQADYVRQFHREVVAFLGFAPLHRDIAERLAARVTAHATPVGSGTVARTKRIDVDERAEAAVIAWMRHQTTAYDSMSIARVAGRRREVRRELAARSRALLERYRAGQAPADDCPLASALDEVEATVERALPRIGNTKAVRKLEVLESGSGEGGRESEGEGGREGEAEGEGKRVAPLRPVKTLARGQASEGADDDARRAKMEAVRARLAQRGKVTRRPGQA